MTNCFCFFLTVEVDDLKKITSSLSVLLSEKQKQEKVSCFVIVYTVECTLNPLQYCLN